VRVFYLPKSDQIILLGKELFWAEEFGDYHIFFSVKHGFTREESASAVFQRLHTCGAIEIGEL
jgi:hypothetical protein